MKAYTGQTRTTLGQLCATLWDSQITASCDRAWIQTRVSVVSPLFHFGMGKYKWIYSWKSPCLGEIYTVIKMSRRGKLTQNTHLIWSVTKIPIGKNVWSKNNCNHFHVWLLGFMGIMTHTVVIYYRFLIEGPLARSITMTWSFEWDLYFQNRTVKIYSNKTTDLCHHHPFYKWVKRHCRVAIVE